MSKERAIELQLIKPIIPGSPGAKGKITLKNLFKLYFRELNVGFYDPCCDDAATCPPISEDEGNIITCNSDGLYAAAGDSGIPGVENGLSILGSGNAGLGGDLTEASTLLNLNGNILVINSSDSSGFTAWSENGTTISKSTGDFIASIDVNDTSGILLSHQEFINSTNAEISITSIPNSAIQLSTNLSTITISTEAAEAYMRLSAGVFTLGPGTADPVEATPNIFGSLYYNTSTNAFRGRSSTGWINLTTSSTALTAGRVPFVASGGTLTDSVGLQFASASQSLGVGATANVNASILIGAGTTSRAPLRLTAGTNQTTPTDGAFEYDGAQLYFTPAGTRRIIPMLEGTLAVDRVLFLSATGISTNNSLRYSDSLTSLGINGTPSSNSYLVIAASTTTRANMRFGIGSVMTTPVTGSFEYDGTNLFFTRAAAIRETILTGLSGAVPPTTSVGGTITNRYGGDTNFLGDPNSWASVVIAGSTFKIPLYT